MMNTMSHIGILKIKNYWKWMFCFLVLFVGSVGMVSGQGAVGSGIKDLMVGGKKVGKVEIKYMMVSEKLKANALSFESLPNGVIDMTKYPDAKLRIKIKLLEDMERKYRIKFTQSKFTPNIKGFSRITRIKPSTAYSKKDDVLKVEYVFNKSALSKSKDFLAITVPIYYKANGQPKAEVNFNSKPIKIINVPGNPPPAQGNTDADPTASTEDTAAEDAANLLTQIKQAKLANDSDGLKVACGEYMDLYYDSASRTIKKDVDDICSPKTSGNNNIVDGKKSSDQYYKEISSTKNPTKLFALLKDYSNAYDNKDPNYSKIYYHVTTIKELPKETQIAFCKQFLEKIKNSSYRNSVQDRLKNLTKKSPPASDPDQKAWNKAVANANKTSSGNKKIEYYEDYLKKWKNYKSKANAEIALLKEEFTIEELSRTEKGRDTEVVYKILGAEGKEPGLSKLPSGVNSVNWNSSSKEMTMSVENEKKYIFNLYVPDNDDKKENVILDLKVPALAFADFEDIGEQLALRISGGKPPYRVQLKNDAGIVIRKKNLQNVDDKWVVNKADLGGNLSGSFSVCVLDDYNNSKCGPTPYTISDWTWLAFPLVLLLLSGVGLMLYRKFKKDQKPNDEFIKAVEENRRKTIAVKTDSNGVASKEESSAKKKITINRTSTEKPLAEAAGNVGALVSGSAAVTPTKILKKPRLQKVVEGAAPEFLIDEEDHQKYRKVDLGDVWGDSIVRSIYIHQIFAARIHNFVFQDTKDLLLMKKEEIPEIGGWILGRQKMDKISGKYDVSFQRFVEIPTDQAESNNSTQITFGTKAWTLVDTQLDTYKEDNLEIVGWFHTHPGWGVFLSRDDVNTHDTMFNKPYQIAMEIESINAPNDVGFFSRKKNLEVNNRDDVKNVYMTWDEFRNWIG